MSIAHSEPRFQPRIGCASFYEGHRRANQPQSFLRSCARQCDVEHRGRLEERIADVDLHAIQTQPLRLMDRACVRHPEWQVADPARDLPLIILTDLLVLAERTQLLAPRGVERDLHLSTNVVPLDRLPRAL